MDMGQIIVTLVAAVISSITTLVVCLINNNAQSNKQKAQLDKVVALLEYRLDELTKKVEQSAAITEKVTRLETMALLMDDKLKDVIKRIEKIEES